MFLVQQWRLSSVTTFGIQSTLRDAVRAQSINKWVNLFLQNLNNFSSWLWLRINTADTHITRSTYLVTDTLTMHWLKQALNPITAVMRTHWSAVNRRPLASLPGYSGGETKQSQIDDKSIVGIHLYAFVIKRHGTRRSGLNYNTDLPPVGI